jgi:hypothetical protein
VHFTSVGVRLHNFEHLSTSNDDLLLLGTTKVALDSLNDASGTLKSQIVKVHFLSS